VTARTLTVDSAPGRIRLDVFVAAELGAEFSRSQASRMIRAGLVRLNGAVARPADAVRAGDTVEIQNPSAMAGAAASPDHTDTAANAPPDAPAIEVLYADDEIVVVNKPAGMTVIPHPGIPAAR
jgi:23S rRNA pseudouridine1911/1915/1917 synthase